MQRRKRWLVFTCCIGWCLCLHAQQGTLFFYGSEKNNLYRLLITEGYTVKKYASPEMAVQAAGRGAAVVLTPVDYPAIDPLNRMSEAVWKEVKAKQLKLYAEYPAAWPGLDVPAKAVETKLERAVVTTEAWGNALPRYSLLGLHNSFVLPVAVDSPLVVLAKVVGFDRAEYGLTNTTVYPLLFKKEQAWIAMTALSNFETGRYGPAASVKKLWEYLLAFLTGQPSVQLRHWPQDVRPAYARNAALPAEARMNSIKKGVDWFFKGHFFVHPAWQADVTRYEGNGASPVGPPLDASKPNGDGRLGVLEGHVSSIDYKGNQGYRYWMRADVQGEASMALAAAGRLLQDTVYSKHAANLLGYLFETSNLRSGEKSNPASAAYGLIGWATTNAGTFYGDDNARAILGTLAACAYLGTDRWNKALAEAIIANFRTTGRQGFRGERLEEKDIVRNGWQFYQNRELLHPSPHFESWMWALYLWLYDKTGYTPLLTKTKNAIRLTMEAYPGKWLWGSSMQTQRARMILPLAWLVRVENTAENRRWLDTMVQEILRYQDESGAIREELGKGRGMFKPLNTNADYGSDEGSLIFRNGEQVACMLYTCNFALFSLNEAATATGNKQYAAAARKLSQFLTRIQVQSSKHPDLDGAWFRAFDYGRWDYWASNSDAGWGAWCTLTGWIQSWIITTQVQMQQRESFWQLTSHTAIGKQAKTVITQMLPAQP